MPVFKYKSFEEAEKHLHKLLPADPLVRLQRLQQITAVLSPPKKIPRGIFRYKSLAEANEHRKAVLGAANDGFGQFGAKSG